MLWLILLVGVALVLLGFLVFRSFSNGNNEERLHLELQDERMRIVQLTAELEREKTKNEQLTETLKKETVRWEEIQNRNRVEFENLVSRLGHQNSDYLRSRNEEQLKSILNPLKEQINKFENRIHESNIDRATLKEEIKRLNKLNIQISEDATNLTNALKGDNKTQGAWGELILERVLEQSGLRKDVEYFTQFSSNNMDDKIIRPDVVVALPDDRHLIIDSKVSLKAYEAYINDAESQEANLKQHYISIKTHIDNLAGKSYETAQKLNQPDFILLFVPIESSFSVLVNYDQSIIDYAWTKKILIVSPTNLLATLKVVSTLWKQENQNKNALEIARQSGLLYDKFVGFVEDMDIIGKAIDKSKDNYNRAMNKLQLGNGNLIDRANKLKELGAQTKK